MDNLLHDKIDLFIMDAMKNHDDVRKETLREIKTSFMKWRTSAENVGKQWNEDVEQSVLNELAKSYKKAMDEFSKAGRQDLYESYQAQLKVIKEYLPADVTEEDIKKCFYDVIGQDGVEPIQKNMGLIIKTIKSTLPTADGKLVADIVKRNLQ